MSERDPSTLRAQVLKLRSRDLRQAEAEIERLRRQVASAEQRCTELAVYHDRYDQACRDIERLKRRLDQHKRVARLHRAKHSAAARLVLTHVEEFLEP